MSVQIPDSAYPLSWPSSWPRAKQREESRFFGTTCQRSSSGNIYRTKRDKSMAEATGLLFGELKRLGATRPVISTNVAVRLDGRPYANQPKVHDPGAPIYFVLKGKPIVLACDKWNRVEDNVYALAKHIESIRAQERWGVGQIEQAFAGYMTLPAPADLEPWWRVLVVREDCDYKTGLAAYRSCAKLAHPDGGGSSEAMSRVNQAWEAAKLSRGWN